MGIQGLLHAVQPYATRITFTHDSQSDGTESAIIDGPGLAYDVYNRCLTRQCGARNAFEALPSYGEVGAAAVAWLEGLEQHGLKVTAAFFDGSLPDSKKDVRISRLQQCANQLVSFRALNKDLTTAASISPTKKSSLPALPFLVPVVIETLLNSRFATITRVEPGEADAYCAQHAKANGGTIFTSDSDLLVHDLGASGKVILFRDLEAVHIAGKGTALAASQYHPAAIAARLQLPDLVKAAFRLKEDPHRSLNACVKLAKTAAAMHAEYADFATEYGATRVCPRLTDDPTGHPTADLSKALARLDPRISEYVRRQARLLPRPVGPPPPPSPSTQTNQIQDMYLPFLLDDPGKTSAWRCGSPIRGLAYSVLNASSQSPGSVHEFERKGTRISFTPMDLLDREHTQTTACALLDRLRDCSSGSRALAAVQRWRLCSVRLLCRQLVEEDRDVPSRAELVSLLSNTISTTYTWEMVHLDAQVQAVLYSLRMLHQILGVFLAMGDGDVEETKLAASCTPLHSLLQKMPRLHELLDSAARSSSGADATVWDAVVTELYAELGIDEPVDEVEMQKRRKRQRKKKRKRKKDGADSDAAELPVKKVSSNMFDVLAR
ncbi:hypothetical protein LTR66_002323 [Elasticomyces elasticus]|nr:hypothetical protein LTR66_002323 [Elasticomyces elasticus]KAK5003309.1 hypothetical protein LTR28_010326 [Elasticomyces elasticus]